MEDDDLEIDDILENKKRKRGPKGKAKGKRGEAGIVDVLNSRFTTIFSKYPNWGQFSRSLGSGNRWGQKVKLSSAATETFSGDLSVPDHFKFTIEVKNGYDDIDLFNSFTGKNKPFDEFLEQATDDAERCGRNPLLIWKKTRKKPIAALHSFMPVNMILQNYFEYKLVWTILLLDDLLKMPDDFFFEGI